MTEWLFAPWEFAFMRWALLCCLVLAGIHAYLGFHVVRRGVLFVDLAMAQMAALGAAVATVIGHEHGTPGSYVLSAVFAVSTAGLFSVIRSRRIPQEAIIAVFYGLGTAASFVVLEHSPHGMEEIKHLFVGLVLTVAPEKVLWTAIAYLVIGLVLWRGHGLLMRVTLGERSIRGDFLFYGAFALVVTSSVELVGVLLVFALLVMPAVAAILMPGPPRTQLAWGWGFAAAGALIGLFAAFHFDLPAAPVVVLSLGALLGVASIIGRRTGRKLDSG